VIGRRRQSEPLNSSNAAAKAEAKAAKREARIVNQVQLSLRVAKVPEHPVGGGTLLTEPILVFHGKPRHDLCVFDHDSNQIGVARWSPDKPAKLYGYGIYAADDEVPLVAINWRTRGWLPGRGDCSVSDSEGIEIATVARLTSTELTPIMVGAERIGYLKPPGWKPGRVEDNKGRKVARIHDHPPCYVAEIEPSLAGPLRTVAVVASIICLEKAAKSSGGGG